MSVGLVTMLCHGGGPHNFREAKITGTGCNFNGTGQNRDFSLINSIYFI